MVRVSCTKLSSKISEQDELPAQPLPAVLRIPLITSVLPIAPERVASASAADLFQRRKRSAQEIGQRRSKRKGKRIEDESGSVAYQDPRLVKTTVTED
jgi:hypothetical protein